MVPSTYLGHPLRRGDGRGSARAAPPRFPLERDPVGVGLVADHRWGMCRESLSQLKSVKGLKSHESLGSSQQRAGLSFSRGLEADEDGGGTIGKGALCREEPLLSAFPSSVLHPALSVVSDGWELRWVSANLERTRSSRSQDIAQKLLL